jgi:hypothetical protein
VQEKVKESEVQQQTTAKHALVLREAMELDFEEMEHKLANETETHRSKEAQHLMETTKETELHQSKRVEDLAELQRNHDARQTAQKKNAEMRKKQSQYQAEQEAAILRKEHSTKFANDQWKFDELKARNVIDEEKLREDLEQLKKDTELMEMKEETRMRNNLEAANREAQLNEAKSQISHDQRKKCLDRNFEAEMNKLRSQSSDDDGICTVF